MMMDTFTIIREAIPLPDVVEGAGITLKPAPGNRYVTLCPFHDEKLPSFTIYPDGGFKCFGCGVSGDVVNFVAKMERLSPLDAARRLDADYGLGLFENELSAVERAVYAQQAEQRKHDRELIAAFGEWERRHHIAICNEIHLLEGLVPQYRPQSPDDDFSDEFAAIIEEITWLDIELDILMNGTAKTKLELFRDEMRRSEMGCDVA